MINLQSVYDEAIKCDPLDRVYKGSDVVYIQSKGFSCIGLGQYRLVFRRKNVVVKFPLSLIGLEDNICEAYAYDKYRKQPNHNGAFFVPCRLLANGSLMMNFVKHMPYADMPQWTYYIDGSQCGIFNSRVVAYDSACQLTYLKDDALRWAGIV
jgi:hypothetical protein